MYKIREARAEDWDEIVRLMKEQDYPFPDFDHLKVPKIVTYNDKIIGFGFFTVTIETTLALDLHQPLRKQVEALKLLTKESEIEAKDLGFTKLYAFVKNSSFVKLLENKFNYQPTNGTALYVEVP